MWQAETTRTKEKRCLDEDTNFDFIEESADSISTCESEDSEVDETDELLFPKEPLVEGSSEVQQRLDKLAKVSISWREYVHVLDWYMLKTFAFCMLTFFACSSLLCAIYAAIIYSFFPEKWLEYFPQSISPRADVPDVTDREL